MVEPGLNVGIFPGFLVFGLCLPKRTLLQTYKTNKEKKIFCLFLRQPTGHPLLEKLPLFGKKSSGGAAYRYSNKKVAPLPLLACKTAAAAATLKK